MKSSFIQKLPLPAGTSFIAQTFTTPYFEVAWHRHAEVELILLTESSGQCFVGNYAGEYQSGDIFMFGSNLPHCFQKDGMQQASAIVIQFRENFGGEPFLNLPESASIRQLFHSALRGIKLGAEARALLEPLIKSMPHQQGFRRIHTLSSCFIHLIETPDYKLLSTLEIKPLNLKEKERIDRVFNYTFEHFRNEVTIKQVAESIQMSVPAFCTYFKKRAHKPYFDFLIEVRVSFASQLLCDGSLPIGQICYECGFNTPSNFHRQFKKIKGISPQKYRQMMEGR